MSFFKPIKILLIIILVVILTVSLPKQTKALTINSLQQNAKVIVNCYHQDIFDFSKSDCYGSTSTNNFKKEQKKNLSKNKTEENTKEAIITKK